MDWMFLIENVADELQRRADHHAIDGHVTIHRTTLDGWAADLRMVLAESRDGSEEPNDVSDEEFHAQHRVYGR